ncbi:MAG: hypothetical protein E3J72_03665 [Planctomycetota bacterium]|nr:MAG: hypothetical protein E3J72_03665 [Planctomycetota bacterium]
MTSAAPPELSEQKSLTELEPENKHAIRIGLVILLIVVLGLRLAGIFAPQSFRDMRSIPNEDGYCYFLIGKNIADGRGMTFDGKRATNGIHPLWQVLAAGGAWLAGAAAPTLMLLLASILDTVTALLVFLIARRVTRKESAGLLAAAIYGLGYHSIVFSLNGSDTTVSAFFFTAFTLAFFMMVENVGWRRVIVFGIVGGLTFLARTDNVALLFAAYIWLFIFSLKGRDRFVKLLAAGVITIAVASPWLVWNMVKFGSIMQQSAMTNSYVFHETFRMEHGGGWPVFKHSLELVWKTLWDQLPRMSGISKFAYFLMLSVFIGIPIFIKLYSITDERFEVIRNIWKRAKPLLVPAIAILIMIVIHSGFRWLKRRSYLQRATPVWAIFISTAITIIVASFRARRPGFVIGAVLTPLVAVFLVAYGTYRSYHPKKMQVFQNLLIDFGHHVRDNVPKDSVIVAHVSGATISYLSGRDVIDLSGNVNPEMYEVHKNRKMTAYLRGLRPQYLLSGVTVSGVSGVEKLEMFSTEKLSPHAELLKVFYPPDFKKEPGQKSPYKDDDFFPAIFKLNWDIP